MRIAVVGATGTIGKLTRSALERDSHDVVPISRSHGVDAFSGAGLAAALAGVHAVIDVTNCTASLESENVRFFTTVTENLLEEGHRAGVGHHVTLSIAGVQKVGGNAHYAGKRAQEAAVESGAVPYTIVPATQFHDFAAMAASWSEHDGVAEIAPLLVQPVAPAEVAAALAKVATGTPQGRHVDIAGPDLHDLVDMARRTYDARGLPIRLVPTWGGGIFDSTMAGDVLLPGADAMITATSFDDWLAEERARQHRTDWPAIPS